jgi:hypothetical protein
VNSGRDMMLVSKMRHGMKHVEAAEEEEQALYRAGRLVSSPLRALRYWDGRYVLPVDGRKLGTAKGISAYEASI